MPAASISQNTFYSPVPICKRQCLLCLKKKKPPRGWMCWHQQSHSTARPCGVGYFANIVSLPFLGWQGSQKNGKTVQQAFILTLVIISLRQNQSEKYFAIFFVPTVADWFLLVFFEILSFRGSIGIHFLWKYKRACLHFCIEFLDSISLIKIQCEYHLLLVS